MLWAAPGLFCFAINKVLLATEGFSAMTSVGRPNSPIDMAVIGFIDHVELVQGVN